jgi:hypothetical protein
MTPEERYKEESISHSGLNAFEISPRSYRRYKDYRDNSNTTMSLNLGSAVHCYILEPDEFYDRYRITPNETPTPMYKKFVEELANTRPLEGVVFDKHQTKLWHQHAYDVAGFKNPGFDRVVERFLQEDLFQDYYKFLIDLGSDKTAITPYELSQIKTCTESTATHKLSAQLLYGKPFAERYNELEILWQYPGYEFKMRSIIDRLVIDEDAKIVFIVDLKTTSKNVYSFSGSYEMYSYHRQLYLYTLAVKHYLNELGKNAEEYQILPYIVAVQTKDNFETAVYKPTQESLEVAKEQVATLIDEMDWHFKNDKWDFPRSYYEGDGSIEVGLNGER